MIKFNCIMIARVPVEVEIPDHVYYNHNILDAAIREKYGDEQLSKMLLEKSYMEHYTRLRKPVEEEEC